MSMQDYVADFLNQIKISQQKKKKKILIFYREYIKNILIILLKNHLIKNFYFIFLKKLKYIKIFLKYKNKIELIHYTNKISKSSIRIYKKCRDIKKFYFNIGLYILSTSYGLLTHKEAYKKNLGGELICYIC